MSSGRRNHVTSVDGSRCAAWVLAGLLAAATSLPVAADVGGEDFVSAALQHGAAATDPDHAGIWKAATPRSGTVHGEFDDNDPVGLAAGVRIRADCSINWVDPDSSKRYCFSTATSLVVFLDMPHAYLARAFTVWRRADVGAAP